MVGLAILEYVSIAVAALAALLERGRAPSEKGEPSERQRHGTWWLVAATTLIGITAATLRLAKEREDDQHAIAKLADEQRRQSLLLQAIERSTVQLRGYVTAEFKFRTRFPNEKADETLRKAALDEAKKRKSSDVQFLPWDGTHRLVNDRPNRYEEAMAALLADTICEVHFDVIQTQRSRARHTDISAPWNPASSYVSKNRRGREPAWDACRRQVCSDQEPNVTLFDCRE